MSRSVSFAQCTAGDPKLWPAWIRHLTLANVCFFIFLGNMYTAGITTGFGELAMEFHVGNSKLTDTVSYPVMALGVGNIIWTPTAAILGKRPTIIASMLIFLGCCIWSIKAPTFDSLTASRVVACFGAGSVESLGPAIIADMYMERYFATSMAVFSFFLSGGAQVGPMIAGFLITAKGWRWFFILCAILIGANLLLVLFFLPETNYRRVLIDGETAQEVDKDAIHAIEHKEEAGSPPAGISASGLNPPYAGSYWKDLINFKNRGTEPAGVISWFRRFSLPFRFVLVPQALFAAASYGVFLGGIVMISTFSPQYFLPPPYLFKASGLGLFSLATALGILVAYPIAGPFTDWLSRYLGRRSRSEFHVPEYRMPALIIPFILAPPGLLLFSYIISEGRSVYIAAIGAALQVSSVTFVPSVVLSVMVDGWPAAGSEAMVLINAGKNLVAFAITVSLPSWQARKGLVRMTWEMAAIEWAVLGLGLPLYFAGPWLRQKTMWIVHEDTKEQPQVSN